MYNSLTSKIVPVIAIDGPSASGKGSVAQLVARALNFHYLDSGALYRIVAFAATKNCVAWNDPNGLTELAKSLNIYFKDHEVFLNGNCITQEVRTEDMSRGASEVAVFSDVRSALLTLQHDFRQQPGLVADGRDMGSVVFSDAQLKIFLNASVETRAQRRYNQLINKNCVANYNQILNDLKVRDTRDSQRNTAPLMQTDDALLLDTTNLGINEAVERIILAYKDSTNFKSNKDFKYV